MLDRRRAASHKGGKTGVSERALRRRGKLFFPFVVLRLPRARSETCRLRHLPSQATTVAWRFPCHAPRSTDPRASHDAVPSRRVSCHSCRGQRLGTPGRPQPLKSIPGTSSTSGGHVSKRPISKPKREKRHQLETVAPAAPIPYQREMASSPKSNQVPSHPEPVVKLAALTWLWSQRGLDLEKTRRNSLRSLEFPCIGYCY